jgi:hypothetical protein
MRRALEKGALALAVMVIVSLPTGSGFGDIAVIVGPGPSGIDVHHREILELAVDVALMRTEFSAASKAPCKGPLA